MVVLRAGTGHYHINHKENKIGYILKQKRKFSWCHQSSISNIIIKHNTQCKNHKNDGDSRKQLGINKIAEFQMQHKLETQMGGRI